MGHPVEVKQDWFLLRLFFRLPHPYFLGSASLAGAVGSDGLDLPLRLSFHSHLPWCSCECKGGGTTKRPDVAASGLFFYLYSNFVKMKMMDNF
ncbi:MAG: hypothetical protein U9M92_00745 [Patescibacteria group bacterium]|nr:hypothetical protein [Patescibacteria group bacterium]